MLGGKQKYRSNRKMAAKPPERVLKKRTIIKEDGGEAARIGGVAARTSI